MPSPILLKQFPPIVQGASFAAMLQGISTSGAAYTTANPAPFLGSDTLTATVSPGESLPSLFSPTCQWVNPSLATFTLQISPMQSQLLAIDTPYLVEVFASRLGERFPLVAGYLPVLPSAGSQAAAVPPDLVSLPYVAQLLGNLSLSAAQMECLPTLITAASNAVRKHCNRYFTVSTLIQMCPVELDGTIRLAAPPVQVMMRVQGNPATAISITNGTATSAWVSAQTTGNTYTNSLVVTGIVLNWQYGGITTSQPIVFTANETISSLANAVGTVGNGWAAVADPILGAWPVTEVYDFTYSKGAGPNDFPDGAAEFKVMSSNITDVRPHPDDGAATGIYWVGRLWGDGYSTRWGPDWGEWSENEPATAQVRVTYTGGFNPIPTEIQWSVAELVKVALERFSMDLILQSESAGQYSYQLGDQLMDFMPKHVLQGLARYRVFYA